MSDLLQEGDFAVTDYKVRKSTSNEIKVFMPGTQASIYDVSISFAYGAWKVLSFRLTFINISKYSTTNSMHLLIFRDTLLKISFQIRSYSVTTPKLYKILYKIQNFEFTQMQTDKFLLVLF